MHEDSLTKLPSVDLVYERIKVFGNDLNVNFQEMDRTDHLVSKVPFFYENDKLFLKS